MNTILKVENSHKSPDKYRLVIDSNTSKLLVHREEITLILSDTLIISLKTACGPPNKNTFELNSKLLSDWIVKKSYHDFEKGQPTKLNFNFLSEKNPKELIFKSKIENKS